MTEQEARQLQAGDRVRWSDGTAGYVVSGYEHCLIFQFENETKQSYIDPRDCELVTRDNAPAADPRRI